MDQDFVPKTRTVVRSLFTRYKREKNREIVKEKKGTERNGINFATNAPSSCRRLKVITGSIICCVTLKKNIYNAMRNKDRSYESYVIKDREFVATKREVSVSSMICIYSNFLSGSLAKILRVQIQTVIRFGCP